MGVIEGSFDVKRTRPSIPAVAATDGQTCGNKEVVSTSSQQARRHKGAHISRAVSAK